MTEPQESTCSNKPICVVCEKSDSSGHRIVKKPKEKDIESLKQFVTKRVDLGELQWVPLQTTLNPIDAKDITYNAGCRGRICDSNKIDRLNKRSQPIPSEDDANILSYPKRGRPSKAASTLTRPQRTSSEKKETKQRICMFYDCEFCQSKSLDDLHQIMTPSIGQQLLYIKQFSLDDKVRVSVSGLEDELDAQAQELWYHKTCFTYAVRSCNLQVDDDPEKLLRQLCDCEIVVYVKEVLHSNEVLTMNEIHDMYVDVLVDKGVETEKTRQTTYNIKLRTAEIDNEIEVNDTQDYKKHLKSLLSQNIPGIELKNPLVETKVLQFVCKVM